MPIYGYACTNCDNTLEAIQKIGAEPLSICPKCNESCLVKEVSAPNFQLKGTGWYATDFKNSGKQQPNINKNNKEVKSESKPDAKAS